MSTPQTPSADEANKPQTGNDGTGKPNGGGQSGQPDTTDYKQKFSESSAEAQRLLNEKKRLEQEKTALEAENARLKQAGTRQSGQGDSSHKPNPSAPSNTGVYVDREEFEQMKKIVAPIIDKEKFNQEFTSLSSMDEYKTLKGKKAEFKEFCYQPENVNVPTEILAARFCMRKAAAKPAETPTAPADEEEPIGLESGSGGESELAPPAEGYTDEQLRELRTSNPRRYAQLARQGKLKKRQ